MATPRRTEAGANETVVITTAAATKAAIEMVGASTESTVAVVAATHRARTEETRPAARPAVTRVGAEAGVVIQADTHVVTEEMETTTEEATAEAVLGLGLRAAITMLAARSAAIAMTADLVGATTTCAALAAAAGIAHPATLHPRS
jgi:hypothetical protein